MMPFGLEQVRARPVSGRPPGLLPPAGRSPHIEHAAPRPGSGHGAESNARWRDGSIASILPRFPAARAPNGQEGSSSRGRDWAASRRELEREWAGKRFACSIARARIPSDRMRIERIAVADDGRKKKPGGGGPRQLHRRGVRFASPGPVAH